MKPHFIQILNDKTDLPMTIDLTKISAFEQKSDNVCIIYFDKFCVFAKLQYQDLVNLLKDIGDNW